MDLTSLAQLVLTVFSVYLLAYQENLNTFSFYTLFWKQRDGATVE